MIAIFDNDGSGDVDFNEFIGGLNAFSAKGNKEEKLKCKDEKKQKKRENGGEKSVGWLVGWDGMGKNDVIKSLKNSLVLVAFKVYDIDRDGFISNGELFLVLKMMVGGNLKDAQLQQIVDKTIMEADLDGDGKVSFEEFLKVVESTDIARQMTVESDKI